MIRHHHEISQFIPLPIEEPQRVRHYLGKLRPSQYAFPMTGIQFILQRLREAAEVLSCLFRKLFHLPAPVFGKWINAMGYKPRIALMFPTLS